MHCKHDDDYEIVVDYASTERFHRSPDGTTYWEEGDPVLYGTFAFYCFQCGFQKQYNSNAKRPKWLSERIAMLGVTALQPDH